MVPLFSQICKVLQPLELKLLLHRVLIHVSHVDNDPEFPPRALGDESKGLTTSDLSPLGRIEMALAPSISSTAKVTKLSWARAESEFFAIFGGGAPLIH